MLLSYRHGITGGVRLISGVFPETKGVRKGPDSGRMKFKSWGVAYIRGFTVHIIIYFASFFFLLFRFSLFLLFFSYFRNIHSCCKISY